jgi:hypothetical protein
MGAGTRWEVAPCLPGQSPEDLDRLFTSWLEAHVFGGERKRVRGNGTRESRRSQ